MTAGAGEATGFRDVGCERIDVLVAEARDARRQVHLCDRRMRVEGAAVGRQGPSVDGVVDRAPHAFAREERPAGVQVDVVDLEPRIDEVLLVARDARLGCRLRSDARGARSERRVTPSIV